MNIMKQVKERMDEIDSVLFDEQVPVYVQEKLREKDATTQMKFFEKFFGCRGLDCQCEDHWMEDFQVLVIDALAYRGRW